MPASARSSYHLRVPLTVEHQRAPPLSPTCTLLRKALSHHGQCTSFFSSVSSRQAHAPTLVTVRFTSGGTLLVEYSFRLSSAHVSFTIHSGPSQFVKVDLSLGPLLDTCYPLPLWASHLCAGSLVLLKLAGHPTSREGHLNLQKEKPSHLVLSRPDINHLVATTSAQTHRILIPTIPHNHTSTIPSTYTGRDSNAGRHTSSRHEQRCFTH